jgi:acyl-CoA thioesterase-2
MAESAWDRSPVVDQQAVDGLVRLLDLEAIEVNLFRGSSPPVRLQRVFGGQVAGQALVAAARTVELDDGGVHSLHAYFLRPGDPSIPILYQVDRIRDGRSFTTRRVVAIQHGEAIFNLQASFHAAEPGMEHQFPMPDVGPPDALPTFKERWAPHAAALGDWYERPRPIDFRTVDWGPGDRGQPLPPRQRVWLRASGALPDDPILHTCVLTYASDMTLLDTTILPHGGEYDEGHLMMASLDHAMWFHRRFRADEWLLYDQDTPSASAGRGLARGLVFTADGKLVASVVQEGLIRRTDR